MGHISSSGRISNLAVLSWFSPGLTAVLRHERKRLHRKALRDDKEETKIILLSPEISAVIPSL